jgi:uncharacterized OB-fold protein
MSKGSDVGAAAVADFDPFWSSLRGGQLSFPRCAHCARFHWYPKTACPFCGSSLLKWISIAGDGVLFSWTTVRHAFSDDYREKTPYVVALVEFKEAPGVRLVSNLVVDDLGAIDFGMRVVPDYSYSRDEPPRVVFVPAK